MKPDIKQRLLRGVLRQVLARRCGNSVPRSGREGEQVNCFVPRVESDGKPYLLIDSLDGNIVKCRRWDGGSFSVETDEPVGNLVDAELTIVHYYGLDTIQFKGLRDFLWNRYTGGIYFRIAIRRAWQTAAQFLFNRRSLRSQQRLRILRILVSRRLAGNSLYETKGFTSFEVMTELYSERWIVHPEHESRKAEVELQLESLITSGDVQKDGITYRATPQSIVTLEQADEQDRRHRDASRLQFWMVVFTLIIAAAAVAQVILSVF